MSFGLESEFDGSCRAVPLFADNDFGLAMRLFLGGLPGDELLGSRAGLSAVQIIFLAKYEEDDIGILLYRAGFAQWTDRGRSSSRLSSCRDNCESAITGTFKSLASALRPVVISVTSCTLRIAPRFRAAEQLQIIDHEDVEAALRRLSRRARAASWAIDSPPLWSI